MKEKLTGRAVVAHAFNFSTWEAEAGGSVQDQPGLQELVPGQARKPQRNPVSKNKNKKIPYESNKTNRVG